MRATTATKEGRMTLDPTLKPLPSSLREQVAVFAADPGATSFDTGEKCKQCGWAVFSNGRYWWCAMNCEREAKRE